MPDRKGRFAAFFLMSRPPLLITRGITASQKLCQKTKSYGFVLHQKQPLSDQYDGCLFGCRDALEKRAHFRISICGNDGGPHRDVAGEYEHAICNFESSTVLAEGRLDLHSIRQFVNFESVGQLD